MWWATNLKLNLRFLLTMHEQLKQKECTKYLGLFIDNKLSWKKQHIETTNLKSKE